MIIYLDSKIYGAIKQLVKYFEDGVFNMNNHEVVFKFYPESFSYYKSILDNHNIRYKAFKKISEVDFSKYKVVYYLFNAQSNCRIVSYRNAKHIFVTHGESNKISSIKPIIRIYDHVICSGQAGIDRLIESKIFTEYDVLTNRILMMGTTFIGQSKYTSIQEENYPKYLLYAPTWEGGVINENYTSIDERLNSFKVLENFATINNITNIILQPHPNTGHRDKRYINYFYNGVKYLLDKNFDVILIDSKISKFIRYKYFAFTKITIYKNLNHKFSIFKAFVDLSAMEVQLINKNIDTTVFLNDCQNAIPKKLLKYYENKAIKNYLLTNIDLTDTFSMKEYYIDYSNKEVESMTMYDRLVWLENFVWK